MFLPIQVPYHIPPAISLLSLRFDQYVLLWLYTAKMPVYPIPASYNSKLWCHTGGLFVLQHKAVRCVVSPRLYPGNILLISVLSVGQNLF